MERALAEELITLTGSFYERMSSSFSRTRSGPWQGWERLFELIPLMQDMHLTLLDLACGNLRFERHLEGRLSSLEVWAADCCDALVGEELPSAIHYQHLDLAHDLDALEAPLVDLAASFGFMHHLPLHAMRTKLLETLLDHTKPGGFVALTFWQFAQDRRLRAKAVPLAGGDEGDYLLGWQDERDVWRYCHSFTEEEIDALVAEVGGRGSEVARYSADGRSNTLNRYLILRRL